MTPPRKTSASDAPLATDPGATLVAAPTPVVAGPELNKKDLLDRVVDLAGVKKKDAKPVVEAMLAVLGQALSEGRELNLQPLGKLKVNNEKSKANAQVLNLRLRRSSQSVQQTEGAAPEASATGEDTATGPLAEPGKDG